LNIIISSDPQTQIAACVIGPDNIRLYVSLHALLPPLQASRLTEQQYTIYDPSTTQTSIQELVGSADNWLKGALISTNDTIGFGSGIATASFTNSTRVHIRLYYVSANSFMPREIGFDIGIWAPST
jgi:hypothetical protein